MNISPSTWHGCHARWNPSNINFRLLQLLIDIDIAIRRN